MANVSLVNLDVKKLAELLAELSQKLAALSDAITAWQSAQDAMNAALTDTNAIVDQINGLGVGIIIPPFSVPTQVDPAWVQSILNAASQVQSQGDALKAATPTP